VKNVSSRVEKHFLLWTKRSCPYCEKAINLLTGTDHSYTIFEMDGALEQLSKVQNQHQWSTVPLIIEQCSDGERNFIGGCTDLEKHLELVK